MKQMGCLLLTLFLIQSLSMAVPPQNPIEKPIQANYDNHLVRLIINNPLLESRNITPDSIDCICINSLTCSGVTHFQCEWRNRPHDKCYECDRGCASYGGRCQ